ncbi:DUF6798 domain-containing protein [Limibacter armeniacum]|uniref:DUF6798 domain-containing protein n=1 Tax=Limibacter armeniacum TaxID=466084 RepID=UPI002FE5FD44
MLHGLANAGLGYLPDDFLANTVDPFPLFSYLVEVTVTYFNEYFLYFHQIVLLSIFVYSTIGVICIVFNIKKFSTTYYFLFLLLTITFSDISSEYISYTLFVFAREGVAKQYLLGNMFQPSVFGVLLILSVYQFLNNRILTATILVPITTYFHSSYLLSAGLIIAAYIIYFLTEKQVKKSIILGLMALLLVIPTLTYILLSFSPTSPDLTKYAQEILVDIRIPHHTKIKEWFSYLVVLKIVLISIALLIVRQHKRLFIIMSMLFFTSMVLSSIQYLTQSNFGALLFPWRVSVLLVPLSSAIILGKVVTTIRLTLPVNPLFYSTIKKLSIASLITFSIASLYLFTQRYIERQVNVEMYSFVKEHSKKGDLYLVPIAYEDFRIKTLTPIFSDFKSHPYKDSEVIEWYNRIEIIKKIYNKGFECDSLRYLCQKYGVTHLLSDKSISTCGFMNLIYKDSQFSIYQIK